jgi:hypothetical protein
MTLTLQVLAFFFKNVGFICEFCKQQKLTDFPPSRGSIAELLLAAE